MKNWNVDASSFNSSEEKRIWELSQLINYGLEGQKISEEEIKKFWPKLEIRLDPERARMIKYLIWNKAHSLTNSKNFWKLSPRKAL